MNKYLEKNLTRLGDAFTKKPSFTTQEAAELLLLKTSSARWILSNLASSGHIIRIVRGVYTFDTKSLSFRTPRLSDEISAAVKKLRGEGITFVLTGLDILLPFVQHQPSRILHLIYTATGAGTWAQAELKSSRFTPLLSPLPQEIAQAFDIVEDSAELIILRERSSTLGSIGSIATLERAFVDLYYEASRHLIPFSLQEVAYIFMNMSVAVYLNTTQMLRYAHTRSIREEIQNILDSIKEPRTLVTSERSAEFLKLLGTIR